MNIYEAILNDLKKGVAKPVYIFSGEEEYFKRELGQKIKSFITESSPEFSNCEVIDGKECDAGSLIIECRTIPFFSSTKLIVVKNADELCSSQELSEYAEHPEPGTCLILMVRKSIPSLKKYEVRFDKLSSRERADWIKMKIKEFKKEISSEAVQLLQESSGEDLERLSSEIEKLVLFVGEKTSVSKEDVCNAHPAGNQEMNIFNLVDTIGNRNKKQALKILRDLISTEDPGKILVMISRQFRLILQAKELAKKGYSQIKIAQEIEIKQSWMVGKLLGQAKNFSSESIVNKFEILADAELNMKSGPGERIFTLEVLISRLCNG
jgi:DNA polymerase III subunit delta